MSSPINLPSPPYVHASDLAPAIDMQLCKRASLFVGNLYSSFSFILREGKL